MDKSIKVILYIVLGLLLLNFGFTFFGSSSLRDVRNNLKQIDSHTDSALIELRKSQALIDSLKRDIIAFRAQVDIIDDKVEVQDIEKRLSEQKDKEIKNAMKDKLKELKSKIDSTYVEEFGEKSTR